MDSTRYFIEQPAVLLLKRVLLLLAFFYCALIKLPVQWQPYRPDLFVLYLFYRTMLSRDNDFGVEKAWLLGLFANVCYPLTFGGLAALMVTFQLIVERYRVMWSMYSAFQWFLVGASLLLPYQVGFFLLYKGVHSFWMPDIGWYMYASNVLAWAVIVVLAHFARSR
jgi:cell shape-determining protein MreD